MTRDEIADIVNSLADLLSVVRDANALDKADIYARLGLKLTYQPADRIVRTEASVMNAAQHWQFDSVRGASAPISQCLLTGEFAIASRS